MNEDLSKKLITDFPLLYRDGFYFDVVESWFNLIYELSENINKIVSTFPNDPNQSPNIVKGHENQFRVVQIKQKFGGLRYYTDNANDEINKLIDEAETKSYKICELCGNDKGSTVNKRGWLTVRCNKCLILE